jgi:GntR family transcriptional repressor for pyruvate dehydrogenase complex
VADRLRDLVVEQGLQVCARLPSERVLAIELGVSRTSVRQGLTAPCVMGLVTIQHGAGAYLTRSPTEVVPPIPADVLTTNTELPAVNEIDSVVEGEGARLAAARRTDADGTRMVAAASLDRAPSARRASRLTG